MTWEAWTTLGVVAFLMGVLIFSTLPADIVMVGCLTLLIVFGIVTPEEALLGLSDKGMVTVGVLFVVVAGLRQTGAISMIGQWLLGKPKTVSGAQMRLMTPVTVLSAFLNNTPVVAMMIPAVHEWSKRYKLSVSKLMIPLSYASILGGTCTLIGTSTNLVVDSLMKKQPGVEPLSLFEISLVGLPCVAAGMALIIVMGRWLLPNRKPPISQFDDPRNYTVEMIVEPNSPLVGKTLEDAGLRSLPGAYVAEIDRQGEVLAAVSSEEHLHANDRLVFVGVVETVVDLQKIRGLTPATDQVFKLDSPRSERCLIEAVVSDTCELVGKTIRDGRFRSVYNAAIIAVARNGQRIHKKIGDIILRTGDTLLLEARPSFAEQQRNSRDFLLVSQIEDSKPVRHERAYVALAILGAMVFCVATEVLPILQAAMLAAGLMLITRCCRGSDARSAVDWQLLIVIAAAFGIGRAMEVSGAAGVIAHQLIGLASGEPWAALAAVYAVTALFTATLTNNAAAVLVFPIAFAASQDLDVSFTPFAITVMMAASACFATPMGYQTNLMVYGPGGYRFSDYLRIGVPLTVLVGVITVLLAPVFWPFH